MKDGPGQSFGRLPAGDHAAEISRGVVALVRRFVGRGPTRLRTTVDARFVLVILEETLTKAEQNLVDVGQVDPVIAMRRTYQEAMRAETKELVERITERNVISMMSDIDPAANIAVALFVLEYVPDIPVPITAELDGELP